MFPLVINTLLVTVRYYLIRYVSISGIPHLPALIIPRLQALIVLLCPIMATNSSVTYRQRDLSNIDFIRTSCDPIETGLCVGHSLSDTRSRDPPTLPDHPL